MARRLIVLFLAIVLAGGAAIYARALVEGQQNETAATAAPPSPVVSTLSVLVANQDLPTGTFVKPSMLRWQEWPEVDLPQAYIMRGEADPQAFEGGVSREVVLRGQPILENQIVLPGDRGFLAAVLDPGMRAMSVPIDEASSHAGLIFPGDRVDLILTQTVQQEEGDSSQQRRASETVLEDIRVIAMGRVLSVNPDEYDAGSSPQFRTATLEVDPRSAEIVALVSEMGKLSLSLRSLARDKISSIADEKQKIATWDDDISAVFEGAKNDTLNLRILRPNGIEETGN
jgi:pilus assembly protein CpaB